MTKLPVAVSLLAVLACGSIVGRRLVVRRVARAGPTPVSTSSYFPPEAVWYRDVSTAALDPQSAAVIAYLDRVGWGLGRMQIDFSIEVLTADATHAGAGLHSDRRTTSGPTATWTPSRCRPGARSRARRATSAAATATATSSSWTGRG